MNKASFAKKVVKPPQKFFKTLSSFYPQEKKDAVIEEIVKDPLIKEFYWEAEIAAPSCLGYYGAFMKKDKTKGKIIDNICKDCPRFKLTPKVKKEIQTYAHFLHQHLDKDDPALKVMTVEQIAEATRSCRHASIIRMKDRKQELDRKEKHLREAFGLDPDIDDIRISNTLKSIKAKFNKEDDIARGKRGESLIQLKKKLKGG